MSVWQVLFDVVVLLGCGAVLGALFERARQSAILGYVTAGVLLGPNVAHVIRGRDEVLAVSELGVALLLFAIGLESSWSRLRSMGRAVLAGGVLQVVLTVAVGATVAWLLGMGPASAFAIGAIVALSSTACVMRTLASRSELESVHGERSLGVLLVQDMAVVPLALVVGVLAEGGEPGEIVLRVARTGGVALGLVLVLWVAFQHVVPRLLGMGPMHSNRELGLLVAVVSGLGSGVAAHAAGVSPALGAFIAGSLLAESPFAVQVRADVSSLKALLLALFFAAVGMLADPAWMAANAGVVALAVTGVLIVKTALVALALLAFGTRLQTALTTGLCLAQVGEFSFVLAGLARGALLDEFAFPLVVSTAVFTMVLTPYLVAVAPRLAARAGRRGLLAPAVHEDDERLHVIVIGFGPAGLAASERVAELGCRVVVIDQNPRGAGAARALGMGAVTGDAQHMDVLEHAGLARAAFVLITIPDARAALQIARLVREGAPAARIVARGRFHRSLGDLHGAGAHVVIDEEHEVGRLIARSCREALEGEGAEPE